MCGGHPFRNEHPLRWEIRGGKTRLWQLRWLLGACPASSSMKEMKCGWSRPMRARCLLFSSTALSNLIGHHFSQKPFL